MRKECKRGFAVFLSCLLILSQGAISYAATVEKNIWATFAGEEPDYESIALYDVTDVSGNEEAEAASKTMFAKLISGESYTATDSTPLFINNASVDASAYPEIDYNLAGDSSINLGSITVSSSASKFPSLTDYEASTVLSTYSDESVYDWDNPYSHTVTDDRIQSVFLKSDTLTVNESKTLSISYTKEGEEGPDNISVESVNAVINGAVVLSGDGNGFVIESDGSLTVGASGSITSLSENCFMEIREGATVTGITLYDWDDGEGSFVAFTTPSENAEVFSYLNIGSEDSPNMQWVKNGAGPVPGPGPGVAPGNYIVDYDNCPDPDDPYIFGASVIVNDVELIPWEENAFTNETPIEFVLTGPEWRSEDTPVIEIVQHITGSEDIVLRSDDDPATITLSSHRFTYTPGATVESFELHIAWSEFDACGNGEGEYRIDVNIDDGISSVALNKETIATVREHADSGNYRFILSDADKEVTVTVTCSEGYEIDEENSTSGFSDGVLTVTSANYDAESRQFNLDIRTKASTPIVPPSPPSTGSDANFAGAKAAVEAVNFGYAGNATSIEEDLEWELWYMYFGYLKRANHEGEFYGMFGTVDKSVDTRSGLNSDNSRNPYTIDTAGPSEAFSNAVTLGSLASSGSLVSGLSYYEFTIDFSLSPNWTGAEGVERYATGRVYALSNYTDIVVGFTNDSNVKDYKVVDASADAFTRTIVYGDYGTNGSVEVFGNGVYAVGATDRQGESAYRYSSHITQEYSNLCEKRSYRYEDGTGEQTANASKPAISANLGIVNKCFKGFKAVGNNAKGTALAWGFGDWPLYWTNGSTDPSSCVFEMYKGSTAVTIESVDAEGIAVGIPSVTNVTCTLPYAAKAVSINSVASGFEITLLSDYYDSIPLEISYSDGSKGYATLKFVAIDIQVNRAGNGGSSIEIFHGNGDTTTVDSTMVISGTYYYLSDQTTRIRLYCTVTFDNGAVMKRVVSPYGSLKDGSANGSNDYDDFIIYKTGDTSYTPIKVEVIAILPNSNGTFGGALIGSGFGVAKNVN